MIKKKILFFLMVIILTFFGVVKAQNVEKIKGDIENQKKQIKKIDKEIKKEQTNLSLIEKKEKELENSISVLEESQKEITGSIKTTESNIRKVESDIASLRKNIDRKNKEIEKNKDLISQNLRMVNRTQQINPVLIFLSSDKFSDFINSFIFINRLNSVLAEQTGKLISKKEQLENLKKKEEKNKAVLVGYRKDLDTQKKQLEKAQKNKVVLLNEAKKVKKEKKKIIAEKKLAKKQFEQQLFDLESKLPKVDVSKLVKEASPGQFMRPVKGGWISAEFGLKSEFHKRIYKNGKGHNGVDFAVPVGTKVVSVADGVVTGTGDSTKICSGVQYGKWILIKHANGVSSMYAHLSHIAVNEGQKVSKGTYIAKSGNTGYSTGAHLHVSMYATKAVKVKWIPHSYAGRCFGKIMKLPISPWSGYLDPFEYIPR